MKITIREAVPSDHAFIFATYLRNRWFDKNNTTTLKRSTWSSLQHKRIEDMLAVGGVLVACLSEDEDVIVGYMLPEGFVYVKQDWRSPGIDIGGRLMKEMSK